MRWRMADKTMDRTIRLRLNSKGILSEYQRVLKEMKALEGRYAPSPKGGYSRRGTSGGGGSNSEPTSLRATPSSRLELSEAARDRSLRATAMSVTEEALTRRNNIIERLRGIEKQSLSVESRQELIRLRKEYQNLNRELAVLGANYKKQQAAMRKSNVFASSLSTSLRHAAVSVASFYTIIGAAKQVFTLGKEMDALRASLKATADTTEGAEENFQFLKDTSKSLGRDLLTSTRGFNRLAVAARGAGFSIEESREIFLAASEASAAFSLDNQRSGLVMLAFSQMMSKGRVSMEELSRQLGENLPIAMKAAEMATGKNSAEVIKLVESGKLLAKDFMLPFAQAVRQLARNNGALEASQKKIIANQNRMNLAFQVLVDDIFQKGKVADLISKVFGMIEKGVTSVTPYITSLSALLSETAMIILDIGNLWNNKIGLVIPKSLDEMLGKVRLFARAWSVVEASIISLQIAILDLLILFEKFNQGIATGTDAKNLAVSASKASAFGIIPRAIDLFSSGGSSQAAKTAITDNKTSIRNGNTIQISNMQVNTPDAQRFSQELMNATLFGG